MSEMTLENPAENKRNRLQFRFLTTGALTLVLALCLMAIYVSWLLYRAMITTHADGLAANTQAFASQISQAQALEANPVLINALAQQINTGVADTLLSLISPGNAVLWTAHDHDGQPNSLSTSQQAQIESIINGSNSPVVESPELWNPISWSGLLTGMVESPVVWTPILDTRGDLQLIAEYRIAGEHLGPRARNLTLVLLFLFTLCCAALFFVLYTGFQRGIRTIESQEVELNHQIVRLSNLLAINRTMQQNMRTASARAVELNEQFLRRVGADLHDGPAQQIGYSVLRLNQISRLPVANEFGHEFAAVREALETSLEEIRGISSGLVLPELEHMTLEQCLRKVVNMHSTKSKAEVAQYYTELPDDIPLPIKITAYRFVQEGLNNAERHGQAQKCRLTAHVSDRVLTVSLKDNGMGFRISILSTAAEGGHLGLMGLKDRVESLGGKLSINSELGTGTAIKFSIKLAEDDE